MTEAEVTQSCITKDHVILINGTAPGPEIRLMEGKIYWIRVFNDMAGQNLTMVRRSGLFETFHELMRRAALASRMWRIFVAGAELISTGMVYQWQSRHSVMEHQVPRSGRSRHCITSTMNSRSRRVMQVCAFRLPRDNA